MDLCIPTNAIGIADNFPGKIGIWIACVDLLLNRIKGFKSVLSPDEIDRAGRFKFSKDFNRYVIQHGLTRALLANLTSLPPNELDLIVSQYGKPFLVLPEQSDFDFNASRSDQYVAIALSKIGNIGIDIERICEIPDMMEIVDRNFTQNESTTLRSMAKRLRLEIFYKFWTRKEAVLKAHGDGLMKPLDGVDVNPIDSSTQPFKVNLKDDAYNQEFWVMDLQGPEGYAAAVASVAAFKTSDIVAYGTGEHVCSPGC